MDTEETTETKLLTVLDVAFDLNPALREKPSVNGEDLGRLGLSLLGGCYSCGASMAAYNAHLGRNGFWRCSDCSDEDNAFTTPAEFYQFTLKNECRAEEWRALYLKWLENV